MCFRAGVGVRGGAVDIGRGDGWGFASDFSKNTSVFCMGEWSPGSPMASQ